MKKIYADSTLKISQGDFRRPDHLSVELDCSKYKETHQGYSSEESQFSGK